MWSSIFSQTVYFILQRCLGTSISNPDMLSDSSTMFAPLSKQRIFFYCYRQTKQIKDKKKRMRIHNVDLPVIDFFEILENRYKKQSRCDVIWTVIKTLICTACYRPSVRSCRLLSAAPEWQRWSLWGTTAPQKVLSFSLSALRSSSPLLFSQPLFSPSLLDRGLRGAVWTGTWSTSVFSAPDSEGHQYKLWIHLTRYESVQI